jgi:hypothetical protein
VILNPGIIALISASFIVVAFAAFASFTGVRIIRYWDLRSGTPTQLNLERKTYLVSVIFAYVSAFQLLSLFMFIYMADHIHSMFVGAMCAAGALNANGYGYPTLVLKGVNFVLCGLWLVVNYADNRAVDYPLIRFKYKFLLIITGLLFVEAFFQIKYFTGLRVDIITSCCGALFSEEAKEIGGQIVALPSRPTMILFFLTLILTLRMGIHFLVTGRGSRWFAGFSAWALILSVVSIVSFISVYFYELPTHHCPFCLLQKDYHYIGYALYLTLLPAGICGVGVGVLAPFSTEESLKRIVPGLQKRLCILSMSAYVMFMLIALYPMVFSDFILESRLRALEMIPWAADWGVAV